MQDDYIILNNESSFKNNIVVVELPSVSIPKERIEEIEVLGLDGNLTISDGTYEPIIKKCKLYYEGNTYDALVEFLKNSGTVIFSNVPDRFYYYKIINEIPLREIIENSWYEFEVTFKCQPFGYALNNDPVIIENKNTIIYNSGTYYAKPKITIYGNGDINLFIGDEQITLKDIKEYITVDTNKLRTYKDTIRQNHKKIGNYPILQKGENNITWDGYISKIEIIPNWRYLM
ncbi:phage tail family protein [Clostridium tertium]|uniref:phage tail family protein n=1 Tax=Clostridium tertium TaxID=1559 RepID=UPI001AE8B6CF|nr:phage tail family protein [Clostridium tertium]MBP1869019.1 phage-related protein [Clostridium tertium]